MSSSNHPSGRRAVIAGGSGLIGRRLAAVLGGAGYDVVILSRAAPRPPVGPVRFRQWAGRPADGPGADSAWEAEIDGCHAVVNLCGESVGGPRWTSARKALLVASRVEPTRALVQAVNRASRPPAVFLQASGVGYYGPGEKAVDERSGRGTDFLADLAERWEAPLASLDDATRPVIGRLGVVLSRSGGALAQMLLPFRLFVGGPVASGNQWLSWIHLHDAATAMHSLIEDPQARGIYNLTAPNPVRNSEFASTAGAALHRPTWMFTPRFLLNALLGEQATLVADGQQALPRRLLAAGFTFTYPGIDTALAEIV